MQSTKNPFFCTTCGTMLAKTQDKDGNCSSSCPNCDASPKDNNNSREQEKTTGHHGCGLETQWQIFWQICLHPGAGSKYLVEYAGYSHETIRMGTIALEEKKLIGYKKGERGAHEYFPLMNEKELREYKLILEKPRTIEDIVKATDSITDITRKRLDELEARGLLYSKTIEEIGTKRYLAAGRNYSLLLRKD